MIQTQTNRIIAMHIITLITMHFDLVIIIWTQLTYLQKYL